MNWFEPKSNRRRELSHDNDWTTMFLWNTLGKAKDTSGIRTGLEWGRKGGSKLYVRNPHCVSVRGARLTYWSTWLLVAN